MYRIFIVEDDPALREQLHALLTRWQYEAVLAQNWDDIAAEALASQAHLIIMDINLPALDGFTWCARIRQSSQVPVLFLSSREDQMDVVMAIGTGGDDYITKPFSPDVLVAKLGALLRRAYDYAPQAEGDIQVHAGVMLDARQGKITAPGGELALTRQELKLLDCLLARKGEVVSRDQLMRSLWDNDEFVNENTLTVNINRLRRRLADIGLGEWITTKKGWGYGILE